MPKAETALRLPRVGLAAFLALLIASLPAVLISLQAAADDDRLDADFRLYLAVPFVATHDRKATRLGLQMLSDLDGDALYSLLPEDREKQTALDLGFTRDGLDKFEVIGADMRGAYDSFARAIGLTPEEVELCRDADCLDWVKPETAASASVADPGAD